jgi:hypothetical protein
MKKSFDDLFMPVVRPFSFSKPRRAFLRAETIPFETLKEKILEWPRKRLLSIISSAITVQGRSPYAHHMVFSLTLLDLEFEISK